MVRLASGFPSLHEEAHSPASFFLPFPPAYSGVTSSILFSSPYPRSHVFVFAIRSMPVPFPDHLNFHSCSNATGTLDSRMRHGTTKSPRPRQSSQHRSVLGTQEHQVFELYDLEPWAPGRSIQLGLLFLGGKYNSQTVSKPEGKMNRRKFCLSASCATMLVCLWRSRMYFGTWKRGDGHW